MEMKLRNLFFVFVSICALLITFDTVWLLASFLSYHPLQSRRTSACQEKFSDFFRSNIGISNLLKDVLLPVLFVLQHSLMAHINIHWFMDKIGCGVLTRSIYVLATCASLQTMMHFWQSVNSVCLWDVPTDDVPTDEWRGSIIWFAFVSIHVMCWFMVYGGCLLVDVGELIGVKQVVYYLRGFSDPLRNKSEDLLRYYKHMRHPSFIGFSLLLWGIPRMSLDRALLALQLTLYMFYAWRTDARDISYLRGQLVDKETFCGDGNWHHQSTRRR